MHPAPQNCNPPELFLYSATRTYLRLEAQTDGRMKMSKAARPNALLLLEVHAGVKLGKRVSPKELYEKFNEAFGKYLP